MSSARDDAVGLARECLFPRLLEAGNAQVRNGESGEPGLRLRAAARRAFVADLAARAGRRAGKRRDRGRMVVRLDLHQDVDGLVDRAVDAVLGIRESSACRAALRSPPRCRDTRRARPAGFFACVLRIIANSDFGCALAVDDPVGVEDLVAAVLGVRLREHHELDVGRIALQARRSSSTR